MTRLLILVAVVLSFVPAAGAQVTGAPRSGEVPSFSGYIYEGAHWLNEGGANDALFRGADSLYGINDTLLTVFSGSGRHHARYPQRWLEQPYEVFYPRTFTYPVAPVTGPTGPLTLLTDVELPEGAVAELRVYLNGVEQTLALAPRMDLSDAPEGGFRYGLHMIVRRPSTGVVVEVLSGVGVLELAPGRHEVELVRQGDRLLLR